MSFSYVNSTAIRIVAGVSVPCTFIPACLRIFIRSSRREPHRADDILAFFAVALTFGVLCAASVGIGPDDMEMSRGDTPTQWDSEQESKYLTCLNVIQTLSCLAIGCIRVSLYSSYTRGRGSSLRQPRKAWGWWILIVINIIWSFFYFVLYLALPPSPASSMNLQQNPFEIAIGYAVDSPRKAFVSNLWIADASLNFFTLVIAFPTLWLSDIGISENLHKAILIFSGIAAIGASVMRPLVCINWIRDPDIRRTWENSLATNAILLWTMIELCFGTIAASLSIVSSPDFVPDHTPRINLSVLLRQLYKD